MPRNPVVRSKRGSHETGERSIGSLILLLLAILRLTFMAALGRTLGARDTKARGVVRLRRRLARAGYPSLIPRAASKAWNAVVGLPSTTTALVLLETRDGPVDPRRLVEGEAAVRLEDRRVGRAVQQESCDEGGQCGELRGRKLAVVVASDLREPHSDRKSVV